MLLVINECSIIERYGAEKDSRFAAVTDKNTPNGLFISGILLIATV